MCIPTFEVFHMNSLVSPRSYQLEILQLLERNSQQNQIVHLAFGAGKTLIALWSMIERRIREPNNKILYLSAGEGGYDRSRQALDMAIKFNLQSELGYCLDPKSMFDRSTSKRKEIAWKEANVIFGPMQAIWNLLDRDFPTSKSSINYIIVDEVADIVSRDLVGWRFHKSAEGLFNLAKESRIPILGLTGSLDQSRLNAVVRLLQAKLITKPEIQPFTYQYSTLFVEDPEIQRIDSIISAGLNDCAQKASKLLDHPITIDVLYELLYAGFLNRLYHPKLSFPSESPLLEKLKNPEDRNALFQILRDFHLYAHGRMIALNSTPDHLAKFIEKYRLPAPLYYSLKDLITQRWQKTGLSSKVLRTIIPIREASRRGPVIVFARFLDLVSQCERTLKANGVDARQLTGQTKVTSRKMLLQEFRDRSFPVLVLSPLGTRGLDLPDVQLVVHLDIQQNTDVVAQRSARIRGGEVWYTIYTKTSEENKLRLLEDRLGTSKHYYGNSFPRDKTEEITKEEKEKLLSNDLSEKQRDLISWFEQHKDQNG